MKKSYDIDAVAAVSRRSLRVNVSLAVIYAILLVLSIAAVIIFSSYLWVFIVGVTFACIFAVLCTRQARRIIPSDCKSSFGPIAEVYKEVKVVRGIVGGINPFGGRMYDSYRKNEIRMDIFIDNGKEIDCYHLAGLTEKHAEYYESRGEAIHIFGAHFPVKSEIKDEWLCPVCGEFNSESVTECSRCKNRILKEEEPNFSEK